MNRPYHTGFFFKVWDRAFGSLHPKGVEGSAMAARARGERSRALWEQTEKPDYSVLLSLSFWLPRKVTVSMTRSNSKSSLKSS